MQQILQDIEELNPSVGRKRMRKDSFEEPLVSLKQPLKKQKTRGLS